jgi:hypothetical protein
MNASAHPPVLALEHATVAVGVHPPVEFKLEGGRWREFLAAAGAIGETPEKLVSDALHFCAETTISTAVFLAQGEERI